MRAWRLIFLFTLTVLGACATVDPPRWRPLALSSLQEATAAGAQQLFPSEYKSTLEALARGEELLVEGEKKESEIYFRLVEQKSELLRREVVAENARRAKEAARIAEEKRLAEEKRKAKEKAELEAARILREQQELQEKAAQAARAAAEAARKKPKPPEKRLVSTYTVRRGESLPLIASQPEVYGDRNLWPLLYRANRDQISDPRHLWPGQVLRVPRTANRDDIAEARRYAQEKPLH